MIGYNGITFDEARPEGPGSETWPHAMLRMVRTWIRTNEHGKSTHPLRVARRGVRRGGPRGMGWGPWGGEEWSPVVARR